MVAGFSALPSCGARVVLLIGGVVTGAVYGLICLTVDPWVGAVGATFLMLRLPRTDLLQAQQPSG